LDYDHPRGQNVNSIVEQLTKAARADSDPWHVYVFKDANFKNAAATRGNHVFIWTGMIDTTKNDDELAAVLAHEIGHVLARHTDPDPDEEMKKLLINLGAIAAGIAAARVTGSPNWGETVGDLTQTVTDQVAKGLLLNPYSRDRELEADQIGLFLMADAGYNPQAAIDFWSRAQGDPSFGSSLTFFSTHPPASERLDELRILLPEALARFDGRSPKPAPYDLDAVERQAQAPEQSPAGRQQPLPPTDSFDVSKADPSLSSPEQRWIVSSSRAVLYPEPDTHSKALGEFTQGAIVTVVEADRFWLKVLAPERGYLQRKHLNRQ
jgi:hypothetical protein